VRRGGFGGALLLYFQSTLQVVGSPIFIVNPVSRVDTSTPLERPIHISALHLAEERVSSEHACLRSARQSRLVNMR
jgi:hypothetical protein